MVSLCGSELLYNPQLLEHQNAPEITVYILDSTQEATRS